MSSEPPQILLPSADDLLDAAERYRWDIDAPGEEGSTTWVVYDNVQQFGKGIGSSRSLRRALLQAYAATLRRQAGATSPEA